MLLQLGGHGDSIAQASKIKIVTINTLPMQIDGEPVLLFPSEILIESKNQAYMLAVNDDYNNIPQCVTTSCSC